MNYVTGTYPHAGHVQQEPSQRLGSGFCLDDNVCVRRERKEREKERERERERERE